MICAVILRGRHSAQMAEHEIELKPMACEQFAMFASRIPLLKVPKRLVLCVTRIEDRVSPPSLRSTFMFTELSLKELGPGRSCRTGRSDWPGCNMPLFWISFLAAVAATPQTCSRVP